jgi:hypothetical protein
MIRYLASGCFIFRIGLFLLVFGAESGRGVAEVDQKFCFAFLRSGDIVLQCAGIEHQITTEGDIETFAVSEKGGALGFTRLPNPRVEPGSRGNTTLVDLRLSTARDLSISSALLDTCGGLFELLDRPNQRSGIIDLVTGAAFSPPGFRYFRCSADRRIVAGARTTGQAEVYIQSGGGVQKLGQWSPPYSLAVSPSGSFVAYASDTSPICVRSDSGGASCASADSIDDYHDVISLDDRGRALVATPTRQVCSYQNWSVFSPTKRTNGAGRDMCLGIGYWEAGMSVVEIIEPIGRNPQWIGPEAATGLRRWAHR